MIKKINPSGKDVLRRNGYTKPKGDNTYFKSNDTNGTYGPSKLDGIAVNDYGVYTVVDSARGRLFTYDNEGYLLSTIEYNTVGKMYQTTYDKLGNVISKSLIENNITSEFENTDLRFKVNLLSTNQSFIKLLQYCKYSLFWCTNIKSSI